MVLRLTSVVQRAEEVGGAITNLTLLHSFWYIEDWIDSICANYTTARPVVYACLGHFCWISVCAAVKLVVHVHEKHNVE